MFGERFQQALIVAGHVGQLWLHKVAHSCAASTRILAK